MATYHQRGNQRGDKRGQSAAGAAVLLAIIAGLLIMFIIMIPPQDRAELLGESGTSTTATGSSSSSGGSGTSVTNLMVATPGKLDFLSKSEIEHPLPVVQVFTDVESKILAEKSMAYAKRGVFNNEPSVLKFEFPNVNLVKNAYLSFKVKNAVGKVIIDVNGENVFYSEVESDESKTIIIPVSALKESNEVTISVASPRLMFWATNEVDLENVKFVADVTSLEAQYSKNVFLVSDDEKRNLEKVVLKFQPECNYGEAGRLAIAINGEEIYNGYPDCDLAMIPIDVSASSISSGENEILFKVDKGKYLLSHILLVSHLKEPDYPTYYFELSEEKYNDINDGTYTARLKLEFVDITDTKKGNVMVNGHIDYFDTKANNYVLDISDDIVKGMNSVKIKPSKVLEIRELKVDLIK